MWPPPTTLILCTRQVYPGGNDIALPETLVVLIRFMAVRRGLDVRLLL
jgi:hypothetical protein